MSMPMPLEVQELIQQCLEKIKKRPQHHLERQDRIMLFQTFGLLQWYRGEKDQTESLWLSKASQVVGWLASITARKVLPIWESANISNSRLDNFYLELPNNIIAVAEGVLQGTILDHDARGKARGDFYYYTVSCSHLFNENIYCSLSSAYSALEVTLFGLQNLELPTRDFAALARDAYAGIDENSLGLWANEDIIEAYSIIDIYSSNNSNIEELKERLSPFELLTLVGGLKELQTWTEERKNQLKVFKPFKYNYNRVLEFWEWWLTEAIPQAWELAQQTKPQ